jgi:hypothetical protein
MSSRRTEAHREAHRRICGLGFRSANHPSGPTTPFSRTFCPPTVGSAPSRGARPGAIAVLPGTNQCSHSRPSSEARLLACPAQAEVEVDAPSCWSLGGGWFWPPPGVCLLACLLACGTTPSCDAGMRRSSSRRLAPRALLRRPGLWPEHLPPTTAPSRCARRLTTLFRSPRRSNAPPISWGSTPSTPLSWRQHGFAYSKQRDPRHWRTQLGQAVLPVEAITMSWLGRAAPATTHCLAWQTKYAAQQKLESPKEDASIGQSTFSQVRVVPVLSPLPGCFERRAWCRQTLIAPPGAVRLSGLMDLFSWI